VEKSHLRGRKAIPMSDISSTREGMRPFDNEDNDIEGQIVSLLLVGIECFRTGKKLDVSCSTFGVV